MSDSKHILKRLLVMMIALAVVSIGYCNFDTVTKKFTHKNILYWQVAELPTNYMNPVLEDNINKTILTNIFEGLTRVDSSGNVQLAAAKSVDISDNGLIYIFKLRDNAIQSSNINDTKVTAKSFEKRWNQLLHENTEESKVVNHHKHVANDLNIVSYKALDATTFKVELSKNTPDFLHEISKVEFMPTPFYKKNDSTYFTNGPFVFSKKSYTDDGRPCLILSKNENYWNKDNIFIDEIIVVAKKSKNYENNKYITENLFRLEKLHVNDCIDNNNIINTTIIPNANTSIHSTDVQISNSLSNFIVNMDGTYYFGDINIDNSRIINRKEEALQRNFPISMRFRTENDKGSNRLISSYITETSGGIFKMLKDIARHTPENIRSLAPKVSNKLFLEHFLFDKGSNKLKEHFNGKYPFSPAHMAYYVGCYLKKDIKKDDTTIIVEDGSKFVATGGDHRNSDVIIIVPVKNSIKLWKESEYALVTKRNGRKLMVKRGLFDSTSKDFKITNYDYIWVAPSTLGYRIPIDGDKFNFYYNLSTMCPKDENGNNAGDVLVSMIKKVFSQDGLLNQVGGFAWDVPITSFKKNSKRIIDANMDGIGDDGILPNGENSYMLGAYDIHKRVREALGENRIFIGDGYFGDIEDSRIQLPSIYNGIEHDINTDHTLREISSCINVFDFYQKYVERDDFNILIRKDRNVPQDIDKRKNDLMKNAFATIMGVAFDDLSYENIEKTKAFSAVDEIKCGKENKIHWLGYPISKIIKLSTNAKDKLNTEGIKMSNNFISSFSKNECDIRANNGIMTISAKDFNDIKGSSMQSMSITRKTIPITKKNGLIVEFDIKCDKLANFPSDVARNILISLSGTDWDADTKLRGWAWSKGWNHVSFYFRECGEDIGDITIEIQGRQNVYIRNFVMKDSLEVLAREFENGLVLVNTNELSKHTFDLDKMFPFCKFKRLDGNIYDKEMQSLNNGESIKDSITLQPQSGIFLIKN
ncbi:ABC transporter substrate-binding protein [Clostridiaceae bacterium M8S5]|nr:ABC transporter substrate-binding protein [Clostridiaceae bacterium M8S5]